MSKGQSTPQVPQSNYVIQQTTTGEPALQTVAYTTTQQPKNVRPIPGVKFLGITTMTIAFLLSMLGIVAIVIEANNAYVGNPIWTGVLFVLPTGILGLTSYWKRTSLCTNITYLVFSILTCVVCFQLVFYASGSAGGENSFCHPSSEPYGYSYYYSHSECQFHKSGRIAVNALIAILAFAQLVICIISLSLTCYGSFACCYGCCGPHPPAMVQYTPQTGACQLVSVGVYQSPDAPAQPVSITMPVNQDGQMTSPGMSVMAQPPMQSQPVLVPAPPIVIQPPSAAANQSVTTANGTTVTDKKLTETSQQQPQPEATISYGQTVSDEFADEQTLLEAI